MLSYNLNEIKIKGTYLDRRYKLNAWEIAQIKKLYETQSYSKKALGEIFNVSSYTITRYLLDDNDLQQFKNNAAQRKKKCYYKKDKQTRSLNNRKWMSSTITYKKDLLKAKLKNI